MFEEEIPLSQHDQLAMAIAQGKSIAEWATAERSSGGTILNYRPDCCIGSRAPYSITNRS